MPSGDGTWAVWCPRERSRGQTCISELSSLSPLGSGRGGHHYGGWGQLLPRTPASLGGPWGGTPQPQSSPRNGVSPIHPARVQWGGQPRGTGHHARVDLARCDQGLRKGPSRPGPPHLPAFFTKPRSASSTSHSSQRKHPGCQLLFMALMTRPMMNSPGRERSLQASTGHTPLPSAAPPKSPSALSWVILELREPMPAGGLWACPLPGPATHSGQCGCGGGGVLPPALPQAPQHGANSIWKSCSQYFRPSNCKWGSRERTSRHPSFPQTGWSLWVGTCPLEAGQALCVTASPAGRVTQPSLQRALAGGGAELKHSACPEGRALQTKGAAEARPRLGGPSPLRSVREHGLREAGAQQGQPSEGGCGLPKVLAH